MNGILVLVRVVGNWDGEPLRNYGMVSPQEGRLGPYPSVSLPLVQQPQRGEADGLGTP